MKRYFVFLFDDYYPSGGMNDFAGDFDTLQDIKDALSIEPTYRYATYQIGNFYSEDNIQIWDTKENKQIDIKEIL